MKFWYSILLGVLFVVCGCATGVDETKAKEPAATVNGRVLTYGELDTLLAAVPANAGVNRNEIRSQLVHQFVTQNALAAAAKKAGLELTSSDINFGKAKLRVGYSSMDGYEVFLDRFPLGREAAKEYFENGLLVDKYLSAELAKVPEVRQEAERIIASVKADNANNGGAGAALEKIKSLKKELDACTPSEIDAKFAELARTNSECPSSRKGGDLGFFGHGMMVREFDEAAFALRPGIVSDPVKTTFGYHLILVTDKKDDQVKASHILIKCGEKPVPTLEEAMSVNVNSAAGKQMRLLLQQALQSSKIVLADEFRGLFAFAGIR